MLCYLYKCCFQESHGVCLRVVRHPFKQRCVWPRMLLVEREPTPILYLALQAPTSASRDACTSVLCSALQSCSPTPASFRVRSSATQKTRLQCRFCCCRGGTDYLVLPTHVIVKRLYYAGFQTVREVLRAFYNF